MLVNESVECQTVTPARGEVTNIDVRISGSLHLAPQQQCVLGRLDLTAVDLLDGYVLDLFTNTQTDRQTWTHAVELQSICIRLVPVYAVTD